MLRSPAALVAAFAFVGLAWADDAPVYPGEVEPFPINSCGNPCVVRDNPGGLASDFERAMRRLVQEHRPLWVMGDCNSMCSVMADGLRRYGLVCIGPRASFGIHQGFDFDERGRYLGRSRIDYSPAVQAWIDAHGGEPTKGVLRMSARQARSFFPACPRSVRELGAAIGPIRGAPMGPIAVQGPNRADGSGDGDRDRTRVHRGG